MAGCRKWNRAGKSKLWSVVGIICLGAHLGLGMGLVGVWSWGCGKQRDWGLLETVECDRTG